jgi:hypothetical protein
MAKKKKRAKVTVTIAVDSHGGIYVDREPIHIDKNTDIEWKHTKDFVVCFGEGSPFKGKAFRSRSSKATSNGLGSGISGNPKKVYKYLVVTDSGETIDPGVIIH